MWIKVKDRHLETIEIYHVLRRIAIFSRKFCVSEVVFGMKNYTIFGQGLALKAVKRHVSCFFVFKIALTGHVPINWKCICKGQEYLLEKEEWKKMYRSKILRGMLYNHNLHHHLKILLSHRLYLIDFNLVSSSDSGRLEARYWEQCYIITGHTKSPGNSTQPLSLCDWSAD